MSVGETDLAALLANMSPLVDTSNTYYFCSVPYDRVSDVEWRYIEGTIREPEGLTLIVPSSYFNNTNSAMYPPFPEALKRAIVETEAKNRGVGSSGHSSLQLPEMSKITIQVHSSLEAVGLTYAMSKALSGANISCNVVAGYYHDHLFVPAKDSVRAVAALEAISSA